MPNASSGAKYQWSAAITQSISTFGGIVEFTNLVKKGSACLFLVLLAHGLILGFTVPTTVLSVVLALVVCLFEAQLVKSERVESEKRIALMVTQFELQVSKVSEQGKLEKEQLKDQLDNLKSQINGIKMNNIIRK